MLNSLVISLCRFGEEIIPDDIARSLSSVHSKGVRLILGQKAIYHPRNDLCRAVIGAKSPVLTAKTGRLINARRFRGRSEFPGVFFNENVSQCKGTLSAQYSKDIADLRRVCESRGRCFERFDRVELPETNSARKGVRKWMYEALAREEE